MCGCPLKGDCLSNGRVNKAVVIGDDYSALLRARRRRRRWSGDDWRLYQRYRRRSDSFHGEVRTWHGLSSPVRPRQHEDPGQDYLTAAAINLKRLGAALLEALSGIWTSRRHFEVRHRARPSSLQSFKQYAWPRSHELQITTGQRHGRHTNHRPVSYIRLPESGVDPDAHVTDTARQVGPHDRSVRVRCRGASPKRSAPHHSCFRCDTATRTAASLPHAPGHHAWAVTHPARRPQRHPPGLASRTSGLRQFRQDSDNGENTSPHETAAITRIPRSSSAADSPATNSRPHA